MEPDKPSDTLNEEVENRLDFLFGEGEAPDPQPSQSPPYPLGELKTIVLSIDWEITDEVMQRFVKKTSELKETFRDDRIILMFLQLLGSLGDYIRTNKSKSHPNAFKLLNSVFTRLDKLVVKKDITEADKKKYLFIELNKYKELKEQIARSKSAAPSEAREPTPQQPPAEADRDMAAEGPSPFAPEAPAAVEPEPREVFAEKEPASSPEQLQRALEDFREQVMAEFRSVRQELHLIRQRLSMG